MHKNALKSLRATCKLVQKRCQSSAILADNRWSKFFDSAQKEFDDLSTSGADSQRLGSLSSMLSYRQKWLEQTQMLTQLDEIVSSTADAEMKTLALEDEEKMSHDLLLLERALVENMLPPDPYDRLTNVMLEVVIGIGGQESMVFARELYNMYERYAITRGWTWAPIAQDIEEQFGGMRSATVYISGRDVYRSLKFETGVHRVQRIPITVSSKKMHTSTSCVSVMPEPENINVVLNDSDLKIETTRAGVKAGGQNVNKVETAVRITHLPTNTVVLAQDQRKQELNRHSALKRLATILFNAKVQRENSDREKNRKLQVGSGGRSEKVRTYNFQQDRVTDHRIRMSVHKIEDFMNAGSSLQNMFHCLQQFHDQERLMEILESLDK